MARPRTEIGTYGEITVKEVAPGKWVATAYFRHRDGKLRPHTKSGPTKTKAKNALKKVLAELADAVRGGSITPDTKIAVIARRWLAEEIEPEREHGTFTTYRGRVNTWIIPRLGELSARELEDSVDIIDDLLAEVKDTIGYPTAKGVRVVAGGICGYAVRKKAMRMNPVRNAKHMSQGEGKEVIVLPAEERKVLLAKLAEYGTKRAAANDRKGRRLGPKGSAWLDLADIAEAQLATGCRIGEVLALDADDVDPSNKTVYVGFHMVNVTGQGAQRVKGRKGGGRPLTLDVPGWSVAMWRRRKLASGGGPLFATWNGSWPDVSNTTKRFREALDAIGYSHIHSHVFRKTVGTHLSERGFTNEKVSDQLGNSPAVVERHYRAKRSANAEVAAAMESIMDTGTDGD